ncbi:MAG: hypothetical protein U5L96_10490 [Owenweeksia sp.]|nr:hypothetical protein [Owenweeksia sp.]
MNRFRSLFYMAALLALFSACEQEVRVNDEWEDTTVVYGLYNANTTENYLHPDADIWVLNPPAPIL